jgi:ribosomal protein S18 acetylase RimI-like enzyme
VRSDEVSRNLQLETKRGVISFRDAEEADIGSIAVFQTACWRETYRGVVPQEYLDRVGVDDREVRWRERLVAGTRRVALATRAEEIIGVVSWGDSDIDDGPALELKSLYVSAEYHGTGVAAQLLILAVGSAPAHLWVFENNVRAHTFYRKHGFTFDGHQAIDPDTGVPERRMSRG